MSLSTYSEAGKSPESERPQDRQRGIEKEILFIPGEKEDRKTMYLFNHSFFFSKNPC